MFCVQYVNDHSRKFLSAYEEHYIFSLSVLGNRVFVLIISLLCPTFMQVITCSQFQHVPFSSSITHQPVPFLTSCIPITKATTSFDIVAYRKKYYGEIILSPSSSHQVIRND